MSLVKWFRKNNTKLMAVVVIVLMIGFVGGSSLTFILRGRGDINKKVAFYGDNKGIKKIDLMTAQQELDILKTLQANSLLKALQDPLEQTPNLQALVLGELLFSEQRPSPEVIAYIKQGAGQYKYRITNKEINDLYKRTAPSFYYWYLLDKEAQNAGFHIKNEYARDMLSQAIPTLTGYSYTQYMTNIMKNSSLSEENILSVFSKLIAILQHSHAVCSGQDITVKQLKNLASSQREGIDLEFVRFYSEKFIDKENSPSEEEISNQFEKYKEFMPNEVTDENPYGFGYKLSKRVQLEYIAIKLDDVKDIITKPTFEELSDFYNTNKSNAFTEQVLSDPNNPDSGTVSRIKPFSEVADDISEYLIQEKVYQKAASILQEAKTLADGALQDINDTVLETLSLEERKEKAGDFTQIAEQLRTKYNVKIYTGLTGELTAENIQADKKLSQLYAEGYVNELSLLQIAFDVEPFGLGLLGSYESIRPRTYISVAPLKDRSASDKIMAMTRVVKAIESEVPGSLDVTFSTKAFDLDSDEEESKEDTFAVKDMVIEDLKKLAAMETTKTKVDEFLEMASSNDDQLWENTIEKFNELYEQEYPKDPNLSEPEDSNTPEFKLETPNFLTKLSKDTLLTITQNQGNPAAEELKFLFDKETQFLDMMFALVPRDSNAPEFEPKIIEFKPDLSYYVIKSISLTPLWQEDYESMKSLLSYRKNLYESQSLALVQFNPANIFKRMNFRYDKEEENEDTTDKE